jgi:putative phosphoribosyl transferase
MTQVTIPVDGVVLDGDLRTVGGAAGVVVFAHGSGSSRHSPRNQAVARGLRDAGFATLLFDLLTAEEGELDARTRQLRFDIDLLSRRLAAVGAWVGEQPATSGLPVAYFGASTGAAAALRAAAARPDTTAAVISRGGRPDLAAGALPAVRCPTLLLVGGADEQVLELNRRAAAAMEAPVQLEVVPDATHLFEEPGALEAVTARAASFLRDLLTDAA